MSLVTQEIPKVGLAMEAVRILRWLKNVGDPVAPGDPLVEVETEKSVLEIEAMASGTLAEVLVHEGEEARVGDPIARIESEAPPVPSTAPDRVRSSPAARRLASERGIDIGAIGGTGPHGRVQLEDVRQVIGVGTRNDAGRQESPTSQALPAIRRALARTMTLSNATIPQFIVERSVDWTVLQDLRNEIDGAPGNRPVRPSINDFLLQAVARTLIEFPAMNATFHGDPNSPEAHIEESAGAHIGLVVAVKDGLRVPVMHDVERLSLTEIAQRRSECVERALAGRLSRLEAEGATFSISNLGARGPDRFTAIINPPQSAILAVGRQRDCVVAGAGAVSIRPMSQLTLTVDHRVADGRLASDFLARLVEILEGCEWRLSDGS